MYQEYVIHKYDLGDAYLKVISDFDPSNPREWDNLGTMVCWHRRYNLGDEHSYAYPEQFEEVFNIENAIILPLYLLDHSGLSMKCRDFGDPWDSGQVGIIYVSKDDIRKNYDCKRITPKIRQNVIDVLKGEVETYDQYLRGDIWGFALVRKEVSYEITYKTSDGQERTISETLPIVNLTEEGAKSFIFEEYGIDVEIVDIEEGDEDEGDILDSCWDFYGDNPLENGMAEHLEKKYRELLKTAEDLA